MLAPSLVVVASARPAGHTAALVQTVFSTTNCLVLNLLDAPLYPYSYSGHYPPDDAFPALVRQLLRHEAITFATPVYWYAMSGLLKTFFDRLTDLVTTEKALGRQLHGKRTFLLATGADEELPPGFEEPFRRTARYFGMTFGGSLYSSQNHPVPAAAFAQAAHVFRSALAPARLL